jgi:PAS domain S-box-containing protein
MMHPSAFSGNSISCEQWLHILDELSIGAFTVDKERRVSSMNLTSQALIGMRAAQAVGQDCREVFLGVPCLASCPFKDGGRSESVEPAIHLSGENEEGHLVTRLASPVYDPKGRLTGCMTILQDLSPIVQLIDRIHHEERSLKMILDSMDIGIFTVNRGGYITFFNTGAETITGFNRRDVLGKPCTALFAETGAEDVCLIKESVTDGRVRISRDGRMATRDGVLVPIRANYLALRNEKEAVVGGLAVFQDLTLMHQLNQAVQGRYTYHDMIGRDPAMRRIFEMMDVVAATDATVLVEGPTGTGKDLCAKVLHSASRRSEKPFVKVNCAAIPENLLESELFGYVKGAFTGAVQDKIGRFQEADGGTILLDEIGDLPLPLQAKLLRVIEEREFYRLGSRHTITVDVRIISATNRPLSVLVKQGLFREDLFYRLNVFRIELPALRDRQMDLPLLIGHVLRRLCSVKGIAIPELSQNAMKALLAYDFPGNVRELENILDHALIVGRGGTIRVRHMPAYLLEREDSEGLASSGSRSMRLAPAGRERDRILTQLHRHQWNRARTARALGIDRTTLWRKIKKYRLMS